MSASYIRGPYANAACNLIDELKRRGVGASVGYFSRRRDRTLFVRADIRDHAKVPAEWQGFRVSVEGPEGTG